MANTITDGRTLVNNSEAANFDNLAGAVSGTLDNEIFVQGSNSNSYFTTSTRDGLLHDFGSATNVANNHFYFWFNCGIVGLLATKANGGVTVRFCGATVTDWFEVNVAGSDDFPPAIQGGWVMFVVDIEAASASPSSTNGTPPATSAIRYVGISTITASVMPRMTDNTWVDAIHRLPDGTAGILVQGQDQTVSAHDWTWDDIVSTAEAAAWGTAKTGAGGAIVLNTSVQFGINDATTHGFSDTNKTILFENQEFAATDLYELIVIGGTGVQSFTAGIKDGTGDAATGSQGWTITAASAGVRWGIDCSDTAIDAAEFFGCNFSHGATYLLTNANVEMRSCTLNDITRIDHVNGVEFARNIVVNADTADGVALVFTDNPTDIKNNNFFFSDGHAMEIDPGAGAPTEHTFALLGNTFTGYGASATNDAAIRWNPADTADDLVLNISGGVASPTTRNSSTGTVTVNNNVTITFTGLKDNTECSVYDDGDGSLIAQAEPATSGSPDDRTFQYTTSASNVVNVNFFNLNFVNITLEAFTTPTSDSSIPVQQRAELNYSNP
jgi:hypothetical protein